MPPAFPFGEIQYSRGLSMQSQALPVKLPIRYFFPSPRPAGHKGSFVHPAFHKGRGRR